MKQRKIFVVTEKSLSINKAIIVFITKIIMIPIIINLKIKLVFSYDSQSMFT